MNSPQSDAQDEPSLLHDEFDEPVQEGANEEFDFSDIGHDATPTAETETLPPAAVEAAPPFQPHSIGGTLMMVIGCGMLIGGVGFATWSALSDTRVPELILRLGVTPFGIVVTAIVLIAIATLRRQQDRVGNRTDGYVAPLHDMLTYLSQRNESRVERDDLDRTLVAIQRLDEKIQNLSRATKMYGKPLVDVATQMQEAANHLQEIEGSLNGVVEKVESSSRRLGEDLSKLIDATNSDDTFPAEQFDDLVAATRKSANILAELKMDLETAPDPTQPIDSLQKSLDGVRAELTELKTGLSNPNSDEGILSGLQEAVAAIHGQVTQLSTTIGSIDRSPAPGAPTPRPAAPATPATPAKPPAQDAKSGLAQSIAGERTSKGKNVLGAIAKLRQMRN